MEMTAEALGRTVRERRKTHGYTQQDLAEAIGASRKFIVDLEAGKDGASLGLVLKAMRVLGLEITANETSAREFADEYARTVREGDYHFAIRLLGEYASASLSAGRVLMPLAPIVDDDGYRTALEAVTRWVAAKTRTPVPRWAKRAKESSEPVYLAEKLHPVSDRMKDLIRRETPSEIAAMNVWIRERDLATV
ncbi:helix-turn-helix domain-containing protein [Zafaria sp. J156]|uniref:helix-turn-helix domain-containing protein n=1 Tax=Zafaria sp. J156 TaxID=3116490 RepID=UPI002E784A01|nr:helix-turn-helix domain-containing protein [Zafaria sp. J156]MEE1621645.1 helix-turn-helix domain-containing protein [Zafaria sp. J156]